MMDLDTQVNLDNIYNQHNFNFVTTATQNCGETSHPDITEK